MQYLGLRAAASKAREWSYAPYSKFTVGAAVLSKEGKIFVGCNVENISLGLTICAERSAIAAAVAAGHRNFEAIAIVTDFKKPALPCGGCRQVIAESNPSMKVLAATMTGDAEQFSLKERLPLPAQGLLEKHV